METVSVTDTDLVEAVALGEQDAFARLYDRHGTRAYSLARRICISPEIAEDVVQDAFLSLWRRPDAFDPARGSFVSWLLTLVHHRAVDAVRREDSQRRRADSAAAEHVRRAHDRPADVAAVQSWENERVRAALAGLGEQHRRVLDLAYFGGYTQLEVADMTGLPLGTVKSRTFAALRTLRTALSALRDVEPTSWRLGAAQ